MTSSEWRDFLQRWSDTWLATEEKFPTRVRQSRWLGFPPATERQILRAEKRLGYEQPPSYRNFLLTTNGWRRTSVFIERVRPVSKIDWLQTDDPALLDHYEPEQGPSMADYAPEDYFAYDDRPIFDFEHFHKTIVIADPIAGDSMLYLLNPLVVAADGEWEAWRFANWIPGAERFPSFELLMRSEHELFVSEGRSREYVGPYEGVYAPDRPRHAAKPIGLGKPRPRRATIPELIRDLESPDRATRLNAAKHLQREAGPHDPNDEHPEIVEPLARILRSTLETKVRSAAAALLGNYGDVGAIDPLVEALEERALASSVLGALTYLSMHIRDARTADAVVRFLEKPRRAFDTEQAVGILEELRDPRVIAIGLKLLDEAPHIPPRDGGKVDLAQAIPHHRSTVRSTGAIAFAKFAPSATQELLKRFADPNAEIRAAAALGLRFDPKRGENLAKHLNPLLDDPDGSVRQQAANSLESLRPPPV